MQDEQSHTDARPSVWLCAGNFGAGSEVWMYRQASHLQRLRLRVVTPNHADPTGYPAAGFSVTKTPGAGGGPSNPLLGQALMAWRALRNSRWGGFRGTKEEAMAIAQLAEHDRPRVALCHYGNWAVRMTPLLESLGVPIIAHFNGHDLSSALRGALYRRRLAEYSRRWAGCVVVADYMVDWLLANGCEASKVHKIPYGSPVDELLVAEQVGQQPCRFVMVGRLTAKKRPDLSIRAFAACLREAPEARLTIIGEGPLGEECRRLAKELGVGDSIEWLGAQPNAIVKQTLAASSVFVQHSVTAENGDKEGWPVAIGEAAGSGLPVVSTRHASIPEQVDDGVTGLLSDELDWKTMGEHMATLATQPEVRERMGAAARDKLLPFDTSNQVRQLEDVLLAACGS